MKNSFALVTVIIGTRPEAIKLSPVIKAFQLNSFFKVRVVLTGQHKELVDEVLNVFNIKYDFNINLMSSKQSLNYITVKILDGLEEEFDKFLPDLVIVQGDTSTAFVAALASFYKKILVGHVEAGLRTDNIYDPFPEEVNRRLISQIAGLHFAPTKTSLENLISSKVQGEIIKTGNTVIDALLIASEKATKKNFIKNFEIKNKLILVTVHRRENRGEKLLNIANGLLKIVSNHQEVNLLIPMHPNPEVRGPLKKLLGKHKRIKLCEPLNYLEIVSAMKQCYLIITDSGGIQEEAPALGKPVLIIRNTTERPEGIESGTAKLIGTESKKIYEETRSLLTNKKKYQMMSKAINPYGDGKASERIVSICLNKLKRDKTFNN